MSYSLIPSADYKAACDAIRAKTGKTGLIKSGDMSAEIGGIETGSGSNIPLNFAFGDTPPEDTTKYWVKTTGINNFDVVKVKYQKSPELIPVTLPDGVPTGGVSARSITDGVICYYCVVSRNTTEGYTRRWFYSIKDDFTTELLLYENADSSENSVYGTYKPNHMVDTPTALYLITGVDASGTSSRTSAYLQRFDKNTKVCTTLLTLDSGYYFGSRTLLYDADTDKLYYRFSYKTSSSSGEIGKVYYYDKVANSLTQIANYPAIYSNSRGSAYIYNSILYQNPKVSEEAEAYWHCIDLSDNSEILHEVDPANCTTFNTNDPIIDGYLVSSATFGYTIAKADRPDLGQFITLLPDVYASPGQHIKITDDYLYSVSYSGVYAFPRKAEKPTILFELSQYATSFGTSATYRYELVTEILSDASCVIDNSIAQVLFTDENLYWQYGFVYQYIDGEWQVVVGSPYTNLNQ